MAGVRKRSNNPNGKGIAFCQQPLAIPGRITGFRDGARTLRCQFDRCGMSPPHRDKPDTSNTRLKGSLAQGACTNGSSRLDWKSATLLRPLARAFSAPADTISKTPSTPTTSLARAARGRVKFPAHRRDPTPCPSVPAPTALHSRHHLLVDGAIDL